MWGIYFGLYLGAFFKTNNFAAVLFAHCFLLCSAHGHTQAEFVTREKDRDCLNISGTAVSCATLVITPLAFPLNTFIIVQTHAKTLPHLLNSPTARRLPYCLAGEKIQPVFWQLLLSEVVRHGLPMGSEWDLMFIEHSCSNTSLHYHHQSSSLYHL